MKKIVYILFIMLLVFIIDTINAYEKYEIGEIVTYNDIYFHVIEDKGSDDDTVTLLKAEPLTCEEARKHPYYSSNYTCQDNDYANVPFYKDYPCDSLDDNCIINYDGSEIKKSCR